MSKFNENLIRSVFSEMVNYKPTLEKHLLVDEDDDDDEVDFRILGDLIIKNFPWPIGVELRRLFSASMRQLDRMRLDQIFKTIERTMQFVSFVMISQAWKDLNEGTIQKDEAFSKEFANRFSVLSLGNFTWLIRSLGTYYEKKSIFWFMPEMTANFNKKFYNELDFWVPERNEIGHYQINLTEEEIEKRCVEYEEKLKVLLIKIAFLTKYKLVSVREINVINTRINKTSFHHVIDLLNSSDSDFKAKELDEDKFVESQSVLLMKSVKKIEEYLNLSPLIIDTNNETLDSKEKFSIKKDIFLYTKTRSDHIYYLGTEVTEKVDLRALSNYASLQKEFKALIQAFNI